MKQQTIIKKEKVYICESTEDLLNAVEAIGWKVIVAHDFIKDEYGTYITVYQGEPEQTKRLIELGFDCFNGEFVSSTKLYLKLNENVHMSTSDTSFYAVTQRILTKDDND